MVKWPQHNIRNHEVLLSIVNRRDTERSAFGFIREFLQRKPSKESPMAACTSVFGGAQLDSLCSYSLCRGKDRTPFSVSPSFEVSSKNSNICRSLRISRHCNDSVFGSSILSHASMRRREWGSCMKPLGKNFHSSNSTSLSRGSPADVSSDGIANEQQLDLSATSTDLKASERKPLKLVSGSCYLPHPEKEKTGGEDAHFICNEEHSIGVADGVGGWVELGINAGIYAQQLMSHSAAAIQQEPEGSIDPMRVLQKAHSLTNVLGSSTACIMVLTDQGIKAANLGDSGFIVVRDGCSLFQSPPQQHGFNFPYQLEFSNNSDYPSSAQVFTIAVATGDLLVAGTDGLFDNLFGEEIAVVARDAFQTGLSPDETAEKIAKLAQQRAMDKECETPFSTAARKVGIPFFGGKLDDITVVISYIT